MLFPAEINAFQVQLKYLHPHIDGLNNTEIDINDVNRAERKFIQIVTTESHGVCISNIFDCSLSSENSVSIYDSLLKFPCTNRLKDFSCKLSCFTVDNVLLK